MKEKSNSKSKEKSKISYHRKPDELSLQEWQVSLRQQYATIRSFNITKEDGHKVFADYNVHNPETKNSYKVSIRSRLNGQNFCSCMDFKTNCLGTCKHIEAVLYKIRCDIRLHRLLDTEFIPDYTSVFLEYGAERKIKIRFGTIKRDEFKTWAQKYFDENNYLRQESIVGFSKLIAEAKRIDDTCRIYPDVIDYIARHHDKNRRHLRLKAEYSPDLENSRINNLINTSLFPYQKEGIFRASLAGRFLIADDMGLGKTIQAIAAAELLRRISGISSVYIVCPTSLKYQWKSEIERFTNSSVMIIEGNKMKREPRYFDTEHFYKIVSYNTVLYDAEVIKFAHPDMVILDEAQRIKNFKTKIALNIKKIQTDFALVLTGTPLENRLEELYSIIQFVDPYALGPFYRFLDEHQIKNENGKITGYRNLNEIGKRLENIMIRRKRSEVLSQLPERMDKLLFVPMTEKQQEVHDEYAAVVAKLISKWIRLGFLPEADRQRLMIALNMMRMACDSTYIIDQQTRNDTKIDELMSLLDEFFEEGDDKVVIFSQWERMTRLVAMELGEREIKYEYLHGGVESSKRKDLFDNFNNDPESRVFLSTDAGGVGLNLQAACLLINLDIPWNPAVLEQRIGRIHRMGQKKNVTIINFVSTATIEHKMLDVLKFKSSLAEGVLENGEDVIFMKDDRFKEFMKTVQKLVDIETHVETVESAEETLQQTVAESEELQHIESAVEMIPENVLNPGLLSDDDVKDTELSPVNVSGEANPLELIQQGISFFSGISKVLADKEATQKLVSSIFEKDQVSGKSYLKIPVENETTIVNTLSLISGLLSAFKK